MIKKIYTLVFLTITFLTCFAQTKQTQYLSGTGSDNTISWDFMCTGGRNSGYWTKIPVPSCWEQQGFGTYNYGRDYKTYGKNYRFADEQGIYKHTFKIAPSWKSKKIFIVFEGSMTDTEVKINGKLAGNIHQGAFYRFKYDITNLVMLNTSNLLEVKVSKMSADVSVNNAERLADYWIFGGIFRPVYLEAVNNTFIDYTAIDAKADGDLAMQVFVKNMDRTGTLSASIFNTDGRIAGNMQGNIAKGDSVITLHTKLAGAKQWTSETPNMYKVIVRLREAGVTISETIEKFGFRTIEVRKGDGIYINGTQVKMKGVNRHCWSPESGRTLNDSINMLDVKLLKEMNMNAVRCSHYPPDTHFLDLCDSLGLYVLDELAGWQKAYSTKAGEPLVREMVVKDINHPSIIFWDNGNEGGTNKELDDDFLKWDYSQRPVIHPHHRPGNAFSGIDCNHYEDYYSTQKILNDSLIYMPTEFLHSQDDGGGGSAMQDFWNLHWKSKKSGGGFIWAMLDEGIVRTDMNNIIDANGLNANDGILGPHREKEGSFFALRDIFSPVQIATTTWPENFTGTIELENRYHFTNLDECTYRWILVNFSKPFNMLFTGSSAELKGNAFAASIPPLTKGDLKLDLPANYKNYDALVLIATDKFKKEICKWTWKLKSNEDLLKDVLVLNDSVTGITETDTTYTMKGGDITISLSKKTGMLMNAKAASSGMDNLSFSKGPVLLQGNDSVISSRIYKEGASHVVEFVHSGNMKYTRWKMNGSGWVTLEYGYDVYGAFPFTGISFNYPENYVLAARWLGKGPYRQWKNRTNGTPVNVWQNFYNNTQTGYSPVIYPEFKGYYGDITWMEFNTVEGRFYVASKDSGLYVRLFDFYGLTGTQPFPALPSGNISFLDCIPAMGTKLALNISANTSALGPQSEPTKVNGLTKRTLYFYFGIPRNNNGKEQYSRPAIDNVF